MIHIARALAVIIGALTAICGAFLLLLLLAAPDLSLAGNHLLFFAYFVVTALFSIYSFIYFFFGREPRRLIQILIAALSFVILYGLMQFPDGKSFVQSIVH